MKMKNNKIFLFNNKKGLGIGTIAAFIIVFLLTTFILRIVWGPKVFAETNINYQLIKLKSQRCKMEYMDAIERGEVAKDIDVDDDGCIDVDDICIADDSHEDSDRDGIPTPCDFLDDYPANTKDNTRYTQRRLCKLKFENHWDEDNGRCCSKNYAKGNEKAGIKKVPICKNAER